MFFKEEWKDIKGFEGLYQVSDFGNIKSFQKRSKTKNVIVLKKTNNIYQAVNLCKNKNRFTSLVHRLVALAFVPNPENKKEVNHIDGNKHNNHVENLEWCTRKENSDHSFKIGLQVIAWGEKSKLCRPVLQFIKDGTFVAEYYGIIGAHRITGIGKFKIFQSAYYGKDVPGEFKWVYKDEAENYYLEKQKKKEAEYYDNIPVHT